MAILPWTLHYEQQGHNIDSTPNVANWIARLKSRPAVARGLEVMADLRPAKPGPQNEQQREILFGKKQFEKH